MAFNLPPDDPMQMLAAQAEALGGFVAAYHSALQRGGLPDELAGELVLQYNEHMLEKFYPLAKPPQPPTPPPTADGE